MGSTYTRQSTFTDGDTITADLFNTEFDQLVAAFAATSGHSHDGTAGEGGPIGGLITPGITLGDNTIDVTLTFDGGSNDGVLKWMEDEDYFEFSDDILIASTEKLQFRDTAIYINSSADGQLDLVADTEIQIAATTIDINGAADISGNLAVGGNLTVTGTTTFNGGTITLGDAAADNVVFGADVDSSIIPDDDDTYDLGSSSQQWRNLFIDGTAEIDTLAINGTAVTATAAELNILDGVTSTAAEINILDGDTSATSTTVADADRVVMNDNGTMVQVAVTDLAAYFDDEITAMPNLVTTAATTVGALNSGSITSGFGTIDTGSSTITTTGLISGGSLDIDSVLINGTTIGHTDDTDLITLANGVVTVAGEVSMTTLDIGGTNVTSTAAELNILDGKAFLDEDNLASNSATGIASQQSIKAYVDGVTTTNITSTGALNAGSITSGFGSIDNGSSTITTTGLISGGSLDIDNVLINGTTIGHTDDTDLITLANGVVTVAGEVSMTTLDIGGTNVTSTAAELNALDGITAVVGELNALDLGSTAVGTAIASKAVVLDSNKDYTGIRNFTITGNLSVGGTTTVVDTVTMNAQNAVLFEGATADAHETTLTIVDPTADRTINLPNQSGTVPVLAAASNTAVTSTPEELNILDGVTATAAELNILDASNSTLGDLSEISTVANDDVFLAIDTSGGGLKRITRSTVVSGLATSSGLSNVVEDTSPQLGGNLDTNSHNILIDDAHFIGDENGNEQIVFQTTSSAVNQIEVTNAASGSGVQIASTGGDTNIDLKLLPKGSGQVVIDGNVGIESGLIDLKNAGAVSKIKFYCESSNAHAQTLQGAPHSEAASNSLTLPSTGGDVDLVSTASTATLTNKTLTSPKINEDVAVTSTATELNVLDGITAVVGELNALDLGSTAVGTAIASKAMVLDSNKDYTGVRNFTLSGELDAGSLDISGNADIDGTLETDALSINGTTVTSTAAELNALDGITAVVGELNALDLGSTAVGTAIASKAVILDSNKDYSGIRNLTISGELDAATLDISGDVDVDGTLETDALSINGTTVTSTAAELNALDGITAVVGELNALDLGSTAVGTAIASKAMILDSNKDYTGVRNFTLSGELDAGSLDVSGDVDVDGTLEADAITVNGTALATVIAGTTVTNATNSAHVLVTDNENTNEENLIAFVEGATSSTGNVGLEMDGNLSYNPSTGTVSATIFKGNIDAVDGDFDGTLEADAITIGGTAVGSIFSPIAGGTGIVTTGALDAGSITSGFGTIDTGSSTITTTGLISGGSLDIDNVLINGTTIGHTDDTDLITVADGLVTVAGEVQMTTLDIGGTNVTSTAAELNVLDGITAVVGELNALDIGSTAVGTAVASKAMILDSNKDYTGVRNFTLSGELDAGSLDISGNADIDGTLETDALSINGTTVTSTAAELNVLDALDRGSLIYGNSSGATAVLGQGSANQVLTSDGTDISWADAAGGPSYTRAASAPGSPSAGDWWYNTGYNILYVYDGTDGWITNSDRGLGGGKFIAPGTFSLIAVNDGDVFTARFETEAQITADINTTIATHSYQPVDADGTSAISSNSSGMSAVSNTTRGVINMSKATTNGYVYLTLATHGSATAFGNAVVALTSGSGCDHATRGVFAVGSDSDNSMEYITIASTGNGTDFGNLTVARRDWGCQAIANTTRGVFCGGVSSGATESTVMDYITIASAGNATDFGDLTAGSFNTATACSIVRGLIFAGGAPRTQAIDYITIASTGNATDFGDHLTVNNPTYSYAIHNKIYAYYARVAGANYQEKHTIATAANATAFTWTQLGTIGTAKNTTVMKGWIAASG